MQSQIGTDLPKTLGPSIRIDRPTMSPAVESGILQNRSSLFSGLKPNVYRDKAGIVRFVSVGQWSNTRELTADEIAHIRSHSDLQRLVLNGPGLTGRSLEAFTGLASLSELHLSSLTISSAALRLLQKYPGLKKLAISRSRGGLSEKHVKEIAKLHQLEILMLGECQIRNGHLRHLAGMPKLRELTINHNPISHPDWKALGSLPELRKLNLHWNRISTPGMQGVNAISQVTDLSLEKNGVFDVSLEELASLKNLTRLNLAQNRIRGSGLAAFTASPCPSIRLYHNPVDHQLIPHFSRLFDSLDILIKSDSLLSFPDFVKVIGDQVQAIEIEEHGGFRRGPVTRLKLESGMFPLYQTFTVECMQALSHCPNVKTLKFKGTVATEGDFVSLGNLTRLESVIVEDAVLSDRTLLTIGTVPNIAKLEFSNVAVTERGLEAISHLSSLQSLILNGGTIDGEDLGYLARCAKLTRLELPGVQSDVGYSGLSELTSVNWLNLTGCKLGTDDGRVIFSMPGLTNAILDGTGIDNRFLFQARVLEQLTSLNVANTRVSPLGLTFVASRFPRLKFVTHRGSRISDSDAQSMANRFGWNFNGDCSCGCMDIGRQRSPASN